MLSELLKYRHGLSPAARNIRNVRHKVDPIVDKDKVHQVEVILRSLIETGFADNCDEELLEFDDDGNLVNVIKGMTHDQRLQQQADAVFAYKDGLNSASEIDQQSLSQSAVSARFYNDRQSVVQSQSGFGNQEEESDNQQMAKSPDKKSTNVAVLRDQESEEAPP